MTNELLRDLGWGPFFQAQINPPPATAIPARVMSVDRGRLQLQAADFETHAPPFHGAGSEGAAAVGDWLLVDANTHRPLRLLDRRSVFKRVAAGNAHQIQVIAANVDTAFVVTSCNQDFNVARLERYLAIAREAQVTPVIVLTKSDQVESPEHFVKQAARIRQGVHVEALNALEPAQAARLAPWCARGQTIALLGSSGVGKSTLVASLTGECLATAPIREHDARGRHTTTRRQLHRLPAGGLLLDTPGMRELQLVDVAEGLAEVFADIDTAAASCRFTDCRHVAEPGCAVLEALKSGQLDAGRLARWRKLVAENARNGRTQAERRARERRFGRFAKQVLRQKQSRRNEPD